MKTRIISYISVVLLMLTTSCTNELALPARDNVNTNGKIKLNISLAMSDICQMPTRGMLDGVMEYPDGNYLTNLNFYLFVFEDNGSSPQQNFLRELVYGKDISVTQFNDMDESHVYTYVDNNGVTQTITKPLVSLTANVNGTAENAIIHIVATADPDFENQLEYVPDRSEFGIFAGASGLYTSTKEAYWKRIELNRPITSDKNDIEAIEKALSHIDMVRNYSRVTLSIDNTENASLGFVPEGFVIVNAIDLGYVAAYNENLGTDGLPGFVEFEATDDQGNLNGMMRSYRDLNDNENYVPARHPASNRTHADDSIGWIADFESDNAKDNKEYNMSPKYMFERSVQNEHKTYVVVKGKFPSENKTRYIKLDIGTIDDSIVGEDNQPFGVFETFQLIRNISYDITITRILNTDAGHMSAESAMGAPPANNISTSIETRPLTTIYDGIDKMQVSQTTVVIVDDDDNNASPATFDMMYRYYKDYLSTNTPDTYHVKWNYPGYDFKFINDEDPDGIIASWDGRTQNGSTKTPVYNENPDLSDAKTFNDDWMGFTLHFKTPDDVMRQKTIRFYNPYGLTRDITFISHKRWEFVDHRPTFENNNIEVYAGAYSFIEGTMPYETLEEMRANIPTSYVGSQRGAQLTVIFELPDDLPEAIFPLDFTIGTDRQNIENAYVGNAVATWGKSLFYDENPVEMYRIQFIKTVTYAEYLQHHIVCARFTTTTDVYAEAEIGNTSTTKVRVYNPYFTYGNDTFDRNAHSDDLDPMRTHWIWNFTYPEWTVYLPKHVNDAAGSKFELDDLNFSEYVWGAYSPYGNYVAIGNGKNAGDGSADNPAFWFNVNTDMSAATNGYTATMKMRTSQNKESYRNWGNWYWYPRTIYVRITYTDQTFDEKSFNNDTRDENVLTGKGDLAKTLQENSLTFDVPSGKQIKDVKIWSTINGNSSYRHQELTRYYWIDFNLEPK